jgi:hypothetical protein
LNAISPLDPALLIVHRSLNFGVNPVDSSVRLLSCTKCTRPPTTRNAYRNMVPQLGESESDVAGAAGFGPVDEDVVRTVHRLQHDPRGVEVHRRVYVLVILRLMPGALV